MMLIKPKFEVIQFPTDLRIIERAARICYKSNKSSSLEELDKFLSKLYASGHESPFEHIVASVEIICSRAISHELVRHRIASFSQESQRYVNYQKSEGIKFVKPIWIEDALIFSELLSDEEDENNAKLFAIWSESCLRSENDYNSLIDLGKKPQEAREVLNNSCATKLMITANFREWIHIFQLRAFGSTGTPHPEMSRIMIPIYLYFKENFPFIFVEEPKETEKFRPFFAKIAEGEEHE